MKLSKVFGRNSSPYSSQAELTKMLADVISHGGGVSQAKELLDCLISPNDYNGSISLLMRAITASRPDMVRLLLNEGAEVNTPPVKGVTTMLLINACVNSNAPSISALYGQYGLYPSHEGPFYYGRNPEKDKEMLKMLKEAPPGEERGPHPAKQNLKISNAIQGVSTKRAQKILNEMLQFGIQSGCKVEVVEDLLDHLETPDTKNFMGSTPLILAVKQNRPDIVQALIRKGANFNLKDNAGKTAEDHADQKDYTEIVKILQEAAGKIEPSFELPPVTRLSIESAKVNPDIAAVLDFAVRNGHREAAEILREAATVPQRTVGAAKKVQP